MRETKPKTFFSLKKDAEWKAGLRTYMEYSDLGVKEATNGKFLAHVLRAKEPSEGPGGYHSHDPEFQINYVLKGWILVDFEGIGERKMEAGDLWYQEPNIKHEGTLSRRGLLIHRS